MSKPYFITGLPRSKTAWMSVVMSGASGPCFHEPTGYLSYNEIKDVWVNNPYDYCGMSDSGLGLMISDILETLEARTLIIKRPIDDVMSSLRSYFKPMIPNFSEAGVRIELESLQKVLEYYENHKLVTVVNYDELAHKDVIESIIGWLTPKYFNPILTDLLHMNIQSDLGYNLNLASRKRKLIEV